MGIALNHPPNRAEPLIDRFLQMQQVIQEKFGNQFSQAIEFYNATEFQHYLPIAKNIIFGSYVGEAFSSKKLLQKKEFRLMLAAKGTTSQEARS